MVNFIGLLKCRYLVNTFKNVEKRMQHFSLKKFLKMDYF